MIVNAYAEPVLNMPLICNRRESLPSTRERHSSCHMEVSRPQLLQLCPQNLFQTRRLSAPVTLQERDKLLTHITYAFEI